MKITKNIVGTRKTNTILLGSLLCAVLGLIWAFSPIFHGVFHLAELPHQHSSASVHSHSHSNSDSHHHHGYDHASETQTHETSDTDSSDTDSSDTERGGSSDQKQDNKNNPEPSDEGSGVFFLVLDVASTNSIAIDVALSESSLPTELVACEEFKIFSATLMGASGPRGPPAV